MKGVLLIVPCGQTKLWDRTPHAGSTAARDAYTGPPFGINKAFAERFGEAWVILSARYGFIEPDFQIPEPYNVRFKTKRTGPITAPELREQVRKSNLNRFTTIIGLGGQEYRAAIEQAFAGTASRLCFPFFGLPIGKMMQATQRALATKTPWGEQRAPSATAPPYAARSHPICHSLHTLFGGLSVCRFPYEESQIPRNGLYIVLEEGEVAHGTSRIVRIGTHTGENQLRSRLKQHFLNESKNRSMFRKNIGRCLLNRDHDPFLAFWDLDLTSRAAKRKHAGQIDFERQRAVERQVSDDIQRQLRFVIIEVRDKAQRLDLESKLISTDSLCGQCRPSPDWLGRHSPKHKIRSSGLWQVTQLQKTPLSAQELQELRVSLGDGDQP